MTNYKKPTIPQIILDALAEGDEMDSFELHTYVYMHYPKLRHLKIRTDDQLYKMCLAGRISKSKNKLTDANSSQSKFVYFT